MRRSVPLIMIGAGLALLAYAASSYASVAPSDSGAGVDPGNAGGGSGGILDWLNLSTNPIDYRGATPPYNPAGDYTGQDATVDAPPTAAVSWGILDTLKADVMGYKTGEYPKYAASITAAESRYGIPTDLLARLLYQESRYRVDIINGATPSPTGALGIAQFMPATAQDMGINPLDPIAAINAAAKYLRQQYNAFGTWALALMAYNWGPGNVRRYVANGATGAVPGETRQYVAQITSDVQVA